MPLYYRRKEEFKIVTPEEILPYVNLAQTPEIQSVVALAWITGSRIQELLNLTTNDFKIDEEAEDGMIIIRALKHGKIGYPSFGFDDPFVKYIILPYLKKLGRGDRLFSYSKRYYQGKLHELNRQIHPDDKGQWITFHYLRHSRITQLSQILRASAGELKSWTGHRSSAYEDYITPRKVDRFKGLLGEG